MADPRVAAAIEHWGPRYVENGVPVGDFLEVSRGVESWDDWCSAWSERAAVHEAAGDAALAGGNGRSAGYHYNTAAVEYHFAKFLFVHRPDEMRAAHAKAVDVHRKAHPLLDPPAERIEIPYLDDHVLFANLRKPAGVDQPPVVVMIPGLDSAKEELSTNEQWFLDRGMATLTIDGPGQGEAEYHLPIDPHYEKAVTAAIDSLERRGDVDTGRLGAWGVSLGGYYVLRATAFEPRIKAAVSLSGPYNIRWDVVSPLSAKAFVLRTHTQTEEEAQDHLTAMDLTGVLDKIVVPVYIMGGDRDRIVQSVDQQRMADEITGPVTFNMIEGGNHVSSNKAYLYRPQSADWMRDRLGA